MVPYARDPRLPRAPDPAATAPRSPCRSPRPHALASPVPRTPPPTRTRRTAHALLPTRSRSAAGALPLRAPPARAVATWDPSSPRAAVPTRHSRLGSVVHVLHLPCCSPHRPPSSSSCS
ncbi:hypothetical protein BS78_05G147600 [Paspalum vaginatum]|nr:hypothetical protein BS78_05G147600 [Paspalum vaginatum]